MFVEGNIKTTGSILNFKNDKLYLSADIIIL